MALDPNINTLEKAKFKETTSGVPAVRVVGETGFPVPVLPITGTPNASVTSVSRSTSVQTALSSNSSRLGFIIWNDSGGQCFIKFGTSATASDFTLRLPANQGYEPPGLAVYQGIVTIIWSAGGAGQALVTEITA